MPPVRALNAIAQKQIDQRQAMWPNVEAWLWDRKANKGFATIPKTMPLILQIMDEMSNGKPLSSTYLGLWCATWDNSFINISKPQEMAHGAGFSGQRAVYTWSARVKLLHQLNFIDIKPGKSGAISHVLIWNPHLVIRDHYQKKTVGLVEGSYNMLLERALEIGAKDMIDGPAPSHTQNAADAIAPVPAEPAPSVEPKSETLTGSHAEHAPTTTTKAA
jgi:hypothetical protein